MSAGASATVYCSDEAHHSIVRAVEVTGLGRRALRRLPIDARRRMRVDALAEALARDRAAGLTPVAVVATAGTTLTGAVDPIGAIADVCEREGVWLHVDGAYGLPAAATGSAGHWFAGLDRADSVTIDAHKWLGVQKSCSVVLLRRSGSLRDAFGHEERYMLHEADAGNPVDLTFEYSRPFRSLRLWLALRVHGAAQFRAWIERTLHIAALLAGAARGAPRVRAAARADALDGLLPPRPGRHAGGPARRPQRAARARDAARRPDLPRAGRRGRAHVPARVLRQLPHHARCGGARARRSPQSWVHRSPRSNPLVASQPIVV